MGPHVPLLVCQVKVLVPVGRGICCLQLIEDQSSVAPALGVSLIYA